MSTTPVLPDSLAVQHAALTDVGRRRQKNEDRYIKVDQLPGDSSRSLVGVIDGVGGYAGGAEAAEIARDVIQTEVMAALLHNSNDEEVVLFDSLIEANNRIHEGRLSHPEFSRMSCVCSVGLLNSRTNTLFYAHVGDSRGYVFRKHELIKFTHDHSYVGFLEEEGTLNEQDAMHHPRRSEIFKMLGEKTLQRESAGSYLEVGRFSFYPGDLVMFCSDGLTDLVNSAQIKALLETDQPLSEKCQALVDAANELGGKDNITVTLSEYPQPQLVERVTATQTVAIVSNPGKKAPKKTVALPKKRRRLKRWVLFLIAFLLGFLANYDGTGYWLNRGIRVLFPPAPASTQTPQITQP